jgi:hypothetical protein
MFQGGGVDFSALVASDEQRRGFEKRGSRHLNEMFLALRRLAIAKLRSEEEEE